MVQKNIIKHPKAIVEVQVMVPWMDLESKWTETLQKMSQDTELPGFRKGQAPLDMVEQKVSAQLQQEVFKTVMPQALIDALQGTNIVPIDYPKYEIVGFQKGQGLNFKALVTERPAVKVGSYKGIKVQKPQLKQISDQDVDKVISDLFKRWKARNPQVSQPTQDQPPSQPQSSDSPDDNFAKAVGAQSLVDLKQKIRADLENEAKYNNELDYEEAILQEVEKLTEVDVPEILVQDELNRMLVSLQKRVADMGLLLDDYLKGQNKTIDQLKNEWRPQAEKNVRMELGLSDIARQENVNISDAELQAEIDKIQDARIKQQFEAQEPRLHLKHALRQTKTLNLLKGLVTGS